MIVTPYINQHNWVLPPPPNFVVQPHEMQQHNICSSSTYIVHLIKWMNIEMLTMAIPRMSWILLHNRSLNTRRTSSTTKHNDGSTR